jgi:hypothetical protein
VRASQIATSKDKDEAEERLQAVRSFTSEAEAANDMTLWRLSKQRARAGYKPDWGNNVELDPPDLYDTTPELRSEMNARFMITDFVNAQAAVDSAFLSEMLKARDEKAVERSRRKALLSERPKRYKGYAVAEAQQVALQPPRWVNPALFEFDKFTTSMQEERTAPRDLPGLTEIFLNQIKQKSGRAGRGLQHGEPSMARKMGQGFATGMAMGSVLAVLGHAFGRRGPNRFQGLLASCIQAGGAFGTIFAIGSVFR